MKHSTLRFACVISVNGALTARSFTLETIHSNVNLFFLSNNNKKLLHFFFFSFISSHMVNTCGIFNCVRKEKNDKLKIILTEDLIILCSVN